MPTERRDIFLSRAKATLTPVTISSQDTAVVPDSNEESQHNGSKQAVFRRVVDVIEISSDESDDDVVITLSPTKPSVVSRAAGNKGWDGMPQYSKRHIIESSEENSSEPEIIELTDSSDDDEPAVLKTISCIPLVQETASPETERKAADDGIIVFDESRSARTPVRFAAKKPTSVSDKPKAPNFLPSTLCTPVSGPFSKRLAQEKPRRNAKKAQVEVEQRRRHEYAQQLFNDLNKIVFNQRLPEGTKLNWNKRLLTTAGRAKFHRSRDGVQTTEIELAEKILDCDERIRNTLSHEMCHLATWVINKKMDEHHGKLFKYWANCVMSKRPDIHVSVKHDYEISYPFNWECAKCAKLYGRFSKSIRPDECRCGVCKEGILVPLFKSRKNGGTNSSKLSRMSAAKPQDSPRASQEDADRDWSAQSDSDSEVKAIAGILALTSIENP